MAHEIYIMFKSIANLVILAFQWALCLFGYFLIFFWVEFFGFDIFLLVLVYVFSLIFWLDFLSARIPMGVEVDSIQPFKFLFNPASIQK